MRRLAIQAFTCENICPQELGAVGSPNSSNSHKTIFYYATQFKPKEILPKTAILPWKMNVSLKSKLFIHEPNPGQEK